MTTYTWPAAGGKAYWPKGVRWMERHNDRYSESPLSGFVQTGNMPGSRWGMSVEFPAQSYAERRELGAWLRRLSGREHRASMFDLANPVRRGTCNLAGVTVSGSVAQFATTLNLAGCGASTTLLAGDWVGVTILGGSQLLMVVADATANGSGVMAVEFRHPARAAIASGSAVVLDRPRLLTILAESNFQVPFGDSNRCPPFTVDFMEVFA